MSKMIAFIAVFLLGSVSCQQLINVTISPGTVQGSVTTTLNGFKMQTFLSIPYAETPPSPRFTATRSIKAFSPNPFNATVAKPPCAMWDTDGKTLDPNSSEDCLYLRILRPTNISCCVPVMFWIQSGGFNDGSFTDYDINALGDNFVSKGIVMVLVNHRQGPFGFFTTGTKDAAGNWGVWDALEALKFVKSYIDAFGGDRNKVTLIGEESGAVMAELLFLSPLANGLYSSVILLDGSAFDPAIIRNDSANLNRSRVLANAVGCDDFSRNLWAKQRDEVLNCLINNSTNILTAAIGRSDLDLFDLSSAMHDYFWRPRVDGKEGILPDTFEILAANRPKVPVLMGVTKDDWMSNVFFKQTIVGNELPANFNTTYNVQTYLTDTCVNMLSVDIFGPVVSSILRDLCVKHYVLGVTPEPIDVFFWLHRAGRIATGLHIMAPLVKSANFLRKQGNRDVFLYSFDYDRSSQGAYWQALGSYRNLDTALVANYGRVPLPLNPNDTAVRDFFVDMLTNFVLFQTPTPLNYTKTHWFTYGFSNCYMSINKTPTMRPCFYIDDTQFWIKNGALD